jgi:predicted TIM-barrel fold metal-dependent hydrolase
VVKLDRRIGEAPFHFENEQLLRYIYEMSPDYRKMFIPFVMVDTLRETRKQVRILTSLLDRYPFYGLKVMPRATQAPLATLAKEGRVLLEFARSHDLPMMVHTAYPGSPDRLSQIADLLDIARAWPKLRFCVAHFCGFHQKTFQQVHAYDNVWVDSAAMSIGCDFVRQKSKIYESGAAKIPADYSDPPKVFAELAHRFPETFMWGTDNPFHSCTCTLRINPRGKEYRIDVWSSMQREKQLLQHVSGKLLRRMTVENALAFLEG